MNNRTFKQPWLYGQVTETIFILLPPFLCLAIIALFPAAFSNTHEMSVTGWVVMILLIDVGHVYTTLYRTYFDRKALRKQKTILFAIPFFSFVAGVIVYSIGSHFFWRLLAYIAVFHFIRQQYGFMRLYGRKEAHNTFFSRLDTIVIYAATLYPIIYWHLKGPRNFNWFIENDFYFFQSPGFISLFNWLYYILLLIYVISVCIHSVKNRYINIPKTLVILGTALSWYFGIIYFNGDMSFTLLNVVSHGIPYMALVWIHGKKQLVQSQYQSRFLGFIFGRYGILLFLLIIFSLAFIEESLWDISVWKEHRNIFARGWLPEIHFNEQLLNFIVPLLALPQLTHYILDGFIWKIRKDEIKWSNEVVENKEMGLLP